MTEMPSYMIKNPKFDSYMAKKRYYNSSSMLSIFLSILSYILIFYVFEVSPSSIFKDTKILFFISNTLILIIAADYGAFTEKENQDFYGEYTTMAATMRSCEDNYSLVPFLIQNSDDLGIKNPKDIEIKNAKEEEPMVKEIKNPKYEEIKNPKEEDSMVKEIVYVPPEKNKVVTDHETVENEEACDARNHVSPKPYGRSKTDKPRRMKITEGKKFVPEKWENVEEESEEFSKMSNEELNKRVEDFIQQFNRQIRLQSRVLSST